MDVDDLAGPEHDGAVVEHSLTALFHQATTTAISPLASASWRIVSDSSIRQETRLVRCRRR